MSDNYSVRFTPLAADDLEQAFDYISVQLLSPAAAAKLMDEIEQGLMPISAENR